jgi:predicted phosphodiesterase
VAQAPLGADRLRETYEAVQRHGSVKLAAASLGINEASFRSRWSRAKTWAQKQGLPQAELAASPLPSRSERLPISVDECWGVMDQWLGRKRVPAAKPPKWKPGKTQRLCIASDFHAPFHDPEAVAELIARESGRTDTLVVNGDLMDHYGVSRFVKHEHVPFEQELAGTDALLAHLSAAFPDVLIVDGNHDAPRFEKQVRALLTPEMMHVVEFLTGGNLSVVKALAKRYKNIRFAPIQVGRFSIGWATQIGDLITTHAEKYSRVPGAALRGIDEWMTDQEATLGLAPWRVLVQAHTHQGGVYPWKADRLLVEGGCMCETHGYQLSARIMGRPQRRGYVTLTQHDGITDLNSVKFTWLDVALRESA